MWSPFCLLWWKKVLTTTSLLIQEAVFNINVSFVFFASPGALTWHTKKPLSCSSRQVLTATVGNVLREKSSDKVERGERGSRKTGKQSKHWALLCPHSPAVLSQRWLLVLKRSPDILEVASRLKCHAHSHAWGAWMCKPDRRTEALNGERGAGETRGGEEGVSSQGRAGKEGGSNVEHSLLYNKCVFCSRSVWWCKTGKQLVLTCNNNISYFLKSLNWISRNTLN